jgi:hypothetical protein
MGAIQRIDEKGPAVKVTSGDGDTSGIFDVYAVSSSEVP